MPVGRQARPGPASARGFRGGENPEGAHEAGGRRHLASEVREGVLRTSRPTNRRLLTYLQPASRVLLAAPLSGQAPAPSSVVSRSRRPSPVRMPGVPAYTTLERSGSSLLRLPPPPLREATTPSPPPNRLATRKSWNSRTLHSEQPPTAPCPNPAGSPGPRRAPSPCTPAGPTCAARCPARSRARTRIGGRPPKALALRASRLFLL